MDLCAPTNKVYNKDLKKCVQPSSCNLTTETTYDTAGNVTCDCTKDSGSCGVNCQYTRSGTCSGNGTPSCSNQIFNGCLCDAGYTGDDCSCKISDMPMDGNSCLGSSYVCKNGNWVSNFKSCNDIKGQYGSITGWSNSCFKELSNNQYYSGAIIGCTDNPEKPVTPIFQGCLQPNKHCGPKQVSLCDSSPKSNYSWICADQVTNNGTCPPTPGGSLCLKDDGTSDSPDCFNCGNNSEWVCKNEGGKPSLECLSGIGIIPVSLTGTSEQIYINTQDGLPVYPTTSTQACNLILENSKDAKDPFFNGQFGSYNISAVLPNPGKATIDRTQGTFTDLTNNARYFLPRGDTNVRCPLPDDQIVKYITKGTPGTALCNGGTFVQNGNLPSGYCQCPPHYIGTNCEQKHFTQGMNCDQASDCISGACAFVTGNPHAQCCPTVNTYTNTNGTLVCELANLDINQQCFADGDCKNNTCGKLLVGLGFTTQKYCCSSGMKNPIWTGDTCFQL